MYKFVMLMVVAGALLLNACGTAAPAAPTVAPTVAPAAAPTEAPAAPTVAPTEIPAATATPASSATRIVTDVNGEEIELPVNPQRIVALTEWDLDAVLALDLPLVGVTTSRGSTTPASYLLDRLEGVEVIGGLSAPNLESLVAVKPDIILTDNFTENLEEMKAIAPVFITKGDTDTDWKAHLRTVATALNQEGRADAFLANYDSRIAEVKGKLGANAGAEISIVRWMADGPTFMLRDAFSSLILADLGLARPAAQQEEGRSTAGLLSLEEISKLDGDWIFIGVLDPTTKDSILDAALNQPLFQQLNAAQNGHVVVIDGAMWTSIGGPLAAINIIDDVESALATE